MHVHGDTCVHVWTPPEGTCTQGPRRGKSPSTRMCFPPPLPRPKSCVWGLGLRCGGSCTQTQDTEDSGAVAMALAWLSARSTG